MARTETMTVRLSPETRWALEVLSRIEQQSVTAVAQNAIENHIRSKIEELERAASTDARVLENALRKKALAPYSRVLEMAEFGPDLMNLTEIRTIALLEDLGVVAPREDEPGFDFDPLVLRGVWDRFASAAENDDLDLNALAELKAFVVEARHRLGIT